MTAAVICSGQGRVDGAMFGLLADEAAAQPVFAAAAKELGRDPRALATEGSAAELQANRASQILCTTRALAAAASLDLPGPLLVAGYSVGEMAAWSIGGWWGAAQCLRLVARRAELMDEAGGSGGGLGHVRGLSRSHVERLAARFGCAVAIVNPGLLFIIGGSREGVSACCAAALAEGAGSARPLAVKVASHTSYLGGAVAPFLAELEAVPLAAPYPERRVIGAAGVRLIDGRRALPGLAAQLAQPIDWAALLEDLAERGVTRMLELGPGSALAEMARSAGLGLDARALDEFRSLAGASAWLSGYGVSSTPAS